ncbi:MAG: glycosyl hydrolase family 18 protein [Tepidisphaerales bacterium]
MSVPGWLPAWLLGGVLTTFAAVAVPCVQATPHPDAGSPETSPASPLLLAGYLPDYRLGGYDLTRASGLSDLVYFSLTPAADGSLAVDDRVEGHLRELRTATRQMGVRLLVSLGGWGRSASFPPLAADPVARERLAAELLRLADRFDLDGFDLDWEHPAGVEQNRHAGELAQTLASRLRPRGLLLTAAVAEWQPLPRTFFDALDRVHLMAYDAPGRHATVDYADAAIRRVIARGVAPEKVLLGVPFYGRQIDPPRGALSWAELLSRFQPPPGADEAGGYSFDSPETHTAKVELVRKHRLAGVMVWELAQDTTAPRSLLANLLVQLGRTPPGLPAPPGTLPVCPRPAPDAPQVDGGRSGP